MDSRELYSKSPYLSILGQLVYFDVRNDRQALMQAMNVMLDAVLNKANMCLAVEAKDGPGDNINYVISLYDPVTDKSTKGTATMTKENAQSAIDHANGMA